MTSWWRGPRPTRRVRLQRHQGRHVGRCVRVRLDLCQHARFTAAHERALRSQPQEQLGPGLRQAQGVQPERRDHARQRRHARHAEPRRDQHGAGVGRHVLFLAGRRPLAAEHAPAAHLAGHAGAADVLRDPGEGSERRGGAQVRRAGDQPGGAGRRHRQALQLVSGHRRPARPGQSRQGRVGEAVQGCVAAGAGVQRQADADGRLFLGIQEGYERQVAN